MKPKIEKTKFGSITIAGEKYDHDVIIRLNGEVKKRKKKLSKEVFGTSHVVSLAEAEHIYELGATRLILGAGQHAMVKLFNEAAAFFEEKQCTVEIYPTPEAAQVWNEAKGTAVGLFHVTC